MISDLCVCKQDVDELALMFTLLDTKKTGRVNLEEFKEDILSNKSIVPENLNLYFLAVDTDEDGNIDFEEFVSATQDRAKMLNEENIDRIFSLFDRENAGFIQKNDLQMLFTYDQRKEECIWTEVMGYANGDDGVISKEAFRNAVGNVIFQGT